jgi:molecular chaperone DnaK (HSP70)
VNPFGIDFGTTNSVLAQWNGTEVEVLAIDHPDGDWQQLGFDRVLPSVLGVNAGRATFGWAAKRQTTDKVEMVKRLFATDDYVELGGRQIPVEEAAALLFGHLRRAAPGLDVDRAVVTIPANSRGVARYRTKLCAGLAGIEVQALINEPTAAAMAFAVDAGRDQNILVFDWGGGTLDVTVLETIEGVFIERASKGIPRSGGIDLDQAFATAILAELPYRPSWTAAQHAQFRLAVELAKIRLSEREETNLLLPEGGYVKIERALFETAIKPKLEEVRRPIEQCLTDLSIGPGDIDQLVLVGGSSKIPATRRFVREIVGRDAATGCDPMTAVAQGAAIASAILLDQLDRDFFVTTEHALGTIVHDEQRRSSFSVLIPRNHQLPARETDNYRPVHQGQEAVRVQVIEGDPGKAVDDADNVVLKEWVIPVDPDRSPQDNAFDITYEYNVDGILHITIVEARTGREMLRDDVSFGVTKDKSRLAELAQRVRTIVAGGTLDGGSGVVEQVPARIDDPEARSLLERTRGKVIPFVGDVEGAELEAMCAELERSTGDDLVRSKEKLANLLRQFAYLF